MCGERVAKCETPPDLQVLPPGRRWGVPLTPTHETFRLFRRTNTHLVLLHVTSYYVGAGWRRRGRRAVLLRARIPKRHGPGRARRGLRPPGYRRQGAAHPQPGHAPGLQTPERAYEQPALTPG